MILRFFFAISENQNFLKNLFYKIRNKTSVDGQTNYSRVLRWKDTILSILSRSTISSNKNIQTYHVYHSILASELTCALYCNIHKLSTIFEDLYEIFVGLLPFSHGNSMKNALTWEARLKQSRRNSRCYIHERIRYITILHGLSHERKDRKKKKQSYYIYTRSYKPLDTLIRISKEKSLGVDGVVDHSTWGGINFYPSLHFASWYFVKR